MARHFNHRRKQTACSSRESFAFNKSHDDSYPQIPRSLLGTPGTMPPFMGRTDEKAEKETLAFLESRSTTASSTKNES